MFVSGAMGQIIGGLKIAICVEALKMCIFIWINVCVFLSASFRFLSPI